VRDTRMLNERELAILASDHRRITIALERRRLRRLAAGRWADHPERSGRRTCRAWSAGCACGAARHVSELERYLKCAVREQPRVELPRTTAP